MAPAFGFNDRRRLSARVIELIEPRKGVSLHDAGPSSEMSARILARSCSRIVEQRRRRISAAKEPIVADVGPYPASDGLQFRQHGHGRIVDMEALGREDMAPDRREDRIKRRDARADPPRQSGDVDFDALARISLALPI